jgi:hypothetical protein
MPQFDTAAYQFAHDPESLVTMARFGDPETIPDDLRQIRLSLASRDEAATVGPNGGLPDSGSFVATSAFR